jgi:hypothetical protein
MNFHLAVSIIINHRENHHETSSASSITIHGYFDPPFFHVSLPQIEKLKAQALRAVVQVPFTGCPWTIWT